MTDGNGLWPHFRPRTHSPLEFIIERFLNPSCRVVLLGETHRSRIYSADHASQANVLSEYGSARNVPSQLFVRDLVLHLYRLRNSTDFRVLALEIDEEALVGSRRGALTFAQFISAGTSLPAGIQHRKAFWLAQMLGENDVEHFAEFHMLMGIARECSDNELVVLCVNRLDLRLGGLDPDVNPESRPLWVQRDQEMAAALKDILSARNQGAGFPRRGGGAMISEAQIASGGKVLAILGSRHVQITDVMFDTMRFRWATFRQNLTTGVGSIPGGAIFSAKIITGGDTPVGVWGLDSRAPARSGSQRPQVLQLVYRRNETIGVDQASTYVRFYDLMRAYTLESNALVRIDREVDDLHPSLVNPPSRSFDAFIYFREIDRWNAFSGVSGSLRPRYELSIPARLTSVYPRVVSAGALSRSGGDVLHLIGRQVDGGVCPTDVIEVVIRSRANSTRHVRLVPRLTNDSLLRVEVGSQLVGMGPCNVELNLCRASSWVQVVYEGELVLG